MSALTAGDRVCLDTNILIYAHDADEGGKHIVAKRLVQQLVGENRLVLSVQALNEFYWAVTKRRRSVALSHEDAEAIVRDLADAGTIVPISAATTILALSKIASVGFSFWDALIWAAAKEGGATVLYSEDFQHGREIEGVRFVNPFLDPSAS